MSKRGAPLGGRYQGIYEKTLADGSKRYTVLVTYQSCGRRQCVSRTTDSLQHAVTIRKELTANKMLHQFPKPETRTTLGSFVHEVMVPIKMQNGHTVGPLLYLQEIVDFFGARAALEAITEREVLRFKKHLDFQECKNRMSGVLSNRSKDHRLVQLRHVLNEARKRRLIQFLPQIRFYRNYGSRQFNLDMETFANLMKTMAGPPKPYRAILLMAYYTGQRRGDLLRMKKEQVKEDQIRFYSSKTGKEFRIRCASDLAGELEKLECDNPTQWLFPNPASGKPYYDIKKPLATASKTLGTWITLHMIRHLTADRVAAITGSAMYTQKYIGWSSGDMVDRYTHLDLWSTPIVDGLEQMRNQPQSSGECCTLVVPMASDKKL